MLVSSLEVGKSMENARYTLKGGVLPVNQVTCSVNFLFGGGSGDRLCGLQRRASKVYYMHARVCTYVCVCSILPKKKEQLSKI